MFGLTGILLSEILHPGKANIAHSNFFIKSSPNLFFVNLGVMCLMIPLLVENGILIHYSENLDKHSKMKHYVVLMTLMLPGTTLLFSSIIIANVEGLGFLLIVLGFYFFKYLEYCIKLYFRRNGKKNKIT